MGTGAERGRRVDLQNLTCAGVVYGLPRRLNQELFTHREGLKILLPAPFPVFLTGHALVGHQSAEHIVGIGCLECGETIIERCDLRSAVVRALNVDLELGLLSAQLLAQLFVYIIPVNLGIL